MSGAFTNITGLAAPTSLAGFASLLQNASFRGVPFHVTATQVRTGRRLAVHQYPFRDAAWPEDLGRQPRSYSFTGYLIGDLAPAMQLALNTVLELPGPGILIHPTIGAVNVVVHSAATSVHHEKMRVISIAFEFLEANAATLTTKIISAVVFAASLAVAVLKAANTDLGNQAGPAAAIGPLVTDEGVKVIEAFADVVTVASADPGALASMAAALPAPDADTTYGRFGAGSASLLLPDGTTIASLQSDLAVARASLTDAAVNAAALARAYSASVDMLTALSAIVEALRAGISDPAHQIRVLLPLVAFSFGSLGLGIDLARPMRAGMEAACRRAALASLARAATAYRPSSYDDALATRNVICDAIAREITIAGDAGDDDTFAALKQLRAAIIAAFNASADLPRLITASFPTSLPALVIAQRLYGDASRADEIAAEANVIHPAFCPRSFQVRTP